MTEPVRIAEAELTGRRAQLATALGGELSARLGRELALEADAVQRLGVLELAPSDDALVHQRLGFSSGEGALHVLLPVRTAALFAALEQGASGEALEAALAAEPDAAALSALTQVMESVADVLRRNFEDAGLPALAVGEAKLVAKPQSDPTWIEDELYARLRLYASSEGLERSPFDFVLRQADLAGAPASARAICFIAVGDAARKRLSGIEGELGASAALVEPAELAKGLDARVLEAAAVVIPWEVEGRSGLELAEALAREPGLAAAAIVLASPRPTRGQLNAALRAGARALIADAFDAGAIRAAVERVGGGQ